MTAEVTTTKSDDECPVQHNEISRESGTVTTYHSSDINECLYPVHTASSIASNRVSSRVSTRLTEFNGTLIHTEVFSAANSLSTLYIVTPIHLLNSGIFAHFPLQYHTTVVTSRVPQYFPDPSRQSIVSTNASRSHLTPFTPTFALPKEGRGPTNSPHHTLPLKKNFYFLSTKFYKEGCSSGYYTNYTNKSF